MKATGGSRWSPLFVYPIFLLVLWRVGSKLSMVVVDLHTFRIISSCSTRKNHKRTRYENTCSLRENIASVAVFCGLFQLLVVPSTWVLLSEGNRNYGKYQCFVWWKVNLLNQKMTSAKYRWKVNGRNLQEWLIMITFSNPKHDFKKT